MLEVGCWVYLQGSEQLAAVLYPGDVKQLVDGAVGQLRPELRVRLDGIQDLVLVLRPGHLTDNIDIRSKSWVT